MNRNIFQTIILFLLVAPGHSEAQVVAVDPIKKGFLFSSGPTLTFLWESAAPKAVLIFLPGGDGQIRLTPDRQDMGGFYGTTLKPLADPAITSGMLNVVVFDSPVSLPAGTTYPHARTTADHLARIESVVLYYKERFNKPVWLMGHSNGAVSMTEFYKYLQKNKKETLIAGMIYSASRDGASFNADTQLPVLFLAHEKDGCSKSTPSISQSVFKKLVETDKQKVEYVLIRGGTAQASDPCYSGHHMFYGAGEEAYKAIDGFIAPYYKE